MNRRSQDKLARKLIADLIDGRGDAEQAAALADNAGVSPALRRELRARWRWGGGCARRWRPFPRRSRGSSAAIRKMCCCASRRRRPMSAMFSPR